MIRKELKEDLIYSFLKSISTLIWIGIGILIGLNL